MGLERNVKDKNVLEFDVEKDDRKFFCKKILIKTTLLNIKQIKSFKF